MSKSSDCLFLAWAATNVTVTTGTETSPKVSLHQSPAVIENCQSVNSKGVNLITVRHLGGGFNFADDWAPTSSNPVMIAVPGRFL
jgi:hypothetical protein